MKMPELRADERMPRNAMAVFAVGPAEGLLDAVLYFPPWKPFRLRDWEEAPEGMAAGYQGA